jgi:hypothetical protein
MQERSKSGTEKVHIYSYQKQKQPTDKHRSEEQNILFDLPIDFTDKDRILNRHMSTHML